MNLDAYVSSVGTQDDAHKILGFSQGMISHWLTGRYEIGFDACMDLNEKSHGLMTLHELNPILFDENDNEKPRQRRKRV